MFKTLVMATLVVGMSGAAQALPQQNTRMSGAAAAGSGLLQLAQNDRRDRAERRAERREDRAERRADRRKDRWDRRRDRADRRHDRREYRHWRRHHAPPGWRRYSTRPWNYRTRGCVMFGPVWFCP